MSSSSSSYAPPCMILDEDELEQAQQIRETFSKGRSYAAVAAAAAALATTQPLQPSWRGITTMAPEFATHSRVFGTSQPASNRIGGFPNAFHSYGSRSFAAAAPVPVAVKEERIAVPSKDPPGTLVNAVRMTFYNSERYQSIVGTPASAPTAITIPAAEEQGPPYVPQTPPYYEEDEDGVPPAELYGGAGAHTPCATAHPPEIE